jgi:uncharacterized DUF497 family protein
MIDFSWDERKNKSNYTKHGISFDEARSVFLDDNARLISDPDHSGGEERFILLGMSQKINILIVIHCYKENESNIRIISARKATKNEINIYQEFLI